jgi:hypothetical protein
MKDTSNTIIEFEKCIEFDPYNDLAKLQLYCIKYLMNEESITFTKINQITNSNSNKRK